LLLLALDFGGNGNHVAVDFDVDVFLLDAGNIGTNRVLAVIFLDVHLDDLGCLLLQRDRLQHEAPEQIVQVAKRVVSGQICHSHSPSVSISAASPPGFVDTVSTWLSGSANRSRICASASYQSSSGEPLSKPRASAR